MISYFKELRRKRLERKFVATENELNRLTEALNGIDAREWPSIHEQVRIDRDRAAVNLYRLGTRLNEVAA